MRGRWVLTGSAVAALAFGVAAPAALRTRAPGSTPPFLVGDSCRSDDPARICLALKYVVYNDGAGPVVSREDAIRNLKQINSLWGQCGIQFQIEQYVALDPAESRLAFRTSNYPELDDIRNRLGEPRSLLLVTTGAWNRSGSLGNTTANAWTAMPNSAPYGVVMEKPVGTYANIIAHELGHYLNLLHVHDNSNLMNPIIYTRSTVIPREQCVTARQAAGYFWQAAWR